MLSDCQDDNHNNCQIIFCETLEKFYHHEKQYETIMTKKKMHFNYEKQIWFDYE